MVPGLNTNVERNGGVFHVQTEDFGRSKPIIQSLIYFAGQVITALESSYEEYALSEEFSQDEIRRELTGQHYRLVAEIEAGGFDIAGGGAAEDGATDESADPVHDYLDDATPYDQVAAEQPAIADRIPFVPAPETIRSPVVERSPLASSANVEQSPAANGPAIVTSAPVVHDPGSPRSPEPRIVVQVQPSAEDRHTIEVRRVVQVHQAVDVQRVVEVERAVQGVLSRLDDHLDPRSVPSKPRRLLPWIGTVVVLALIALAVVVWQLRPNPAATRVAESRTPPASVPAAVASVDPTPEAETPAKRVTPPDAAAASATRAAPALDRTSEASTEPARPAEPRPPRVEASPKRTAPDPARSAPSPVVPTPEVRPQAKPPAAGVTKPVAPDRHGETPPVSPTPVETVAEVEEAAPIASTGSDSGPAEGDELAASLAPPVPRPPADAPDPLRELEAGTRDAEPALTPPDAGPAPAQKVRPGMLLDLALVDVVPKPMQREIPEYPKRARKKNHQGDVKLNLLIDERGNVAQVKLADGVAESDLSDAAVAAARAWRYSPARKERHVVKVWKPVTVRFTLDGGNASRVRVEE